MLEATFEIHSAMKVSKMNILDNKFANLVVDLFTYQMIIMLKSQ